MLSVFEEDMSRKWLFDQDIGDKDNNRPHFSDMRTECPVTDQD